MNACGCMRRKFTTTCQRAVKRLLQRANGYDATFVAGQQVWAHGEATGALPGRLLRSKAP